MLRWLQLQLHNGSMRGLADHRTCSFAHRNAFDGSIVRTYRHSIRGSLAVPHFGTFIHSEHFTLIPSKSFPNHGTNSFTINFPILFSNFYSSYSLSDRVADPFIERFSDAIALI
jgi:hypothetical protein